MTGWRLLLTRPAEECAALAATLAEHQVASSSLPLLAIQPLEESPEQRGLVLALDRYCAVVVVSKPAARLGLDLLDRHGRQPPASLRWFAVGAATGALLEGHGLPASWPEAGDDSEALLGLPAFTEALATAEPRVLIMRGEGGREFLADRLRDQGVAVDYLELYRRCLPEYPSGTLARRIEVEQLNGLVVSSGQGLANLLLLAGDDWAGMARLPLFVPSPRVAEQAMAAGAKNVVDCRGASATALLAALRQHPAPAP
ncbi:uroporphyrinogen-III synthase [Metapseudomonas furukawaii]|uniref:uroporphyrinogen-III synthase n=1 Tax=Metapseudomonas furukawaii TaxID=1149133 RepID=UPI0040462EA5